MASSYTFDDILKYRPEKIHDPPAGLMYIVLSGALSRSGNDLKRSSRVGSRGTRWNRDGNRDERRDNVVQPVLEESSNSFSAARRRPELNQTTKTISEVRVLLNKVTDDNMDVILREAREVSCPKLQSLVDSLESSDEQEAILMQLAKLFVQKAQVDHAFSKWYAEIAAKLVLREFGDVLYEVCREALPQYRYDPDEKRKYLGALLLLVELRRFNMVSLMNLEAAADRIFSAIARNLGTVVMATTTEVPIDPVVQIEVCIELLCKYLVAFFALEKPTSATMEKYLHTLKDLGNSPNNATRVKPRARFLLMDFFKTIEGH